MNGLFHVAQCEPRPGSGALSGSGAGSGSSGSLNGAGCEIGPGAGAFLARHGWEASITLPAGEAYVCRVYDSLEGYPEQALELPRYLESFAKPC